MRFFEEVQDNINKHDNVDGVLESFEVLLVVVDTIGLGPTITAIPAMFWITCLVNFGEDEEEWRYKDCVHG